MCYLDTAAIGESYPSTDVLDNRISLPVHCNINASKIDLLLHRDISM
jgi:hypothetical protein